MGGVRSSLVGSDRRRRLTRLSSRRWLAATPARGHGASAAPTRTGAYLSMRSVDSPNAPAIWVIRALPHPKVDFSTARGHSPQDFTKARLTMNRRIRHAAVAAFMATVLLPAPLRAEVSRVGITAHRDVAGGRSFGAAGPYEQIVGKLYFAIDPVNKRNLVI